MGPPSPRRFRLVCCTALLVASGAGGAGAQPAKRPLAPAPRVEFDPGPALEPAGALTAWLATQGEADTPRLVRLPVTLELGALGIGRARLGTTPIAVSDAALGIALADRARQACGKKATCTLWLVGHWRAGTLHLRDTGGVVDESVPPRAFVEKVRP